MGNVKSRNVTDILTKAVTNVSTSLMQNINLKTSQSNVISVVGSKDDVLITGVRQRLQVRIEMAGLMKALSSNEAKTQMISQIEQEAKSAISGVLNFLQFAESQNVIKQVMDLAITLSTDVTQTCAAYANQSNVITVYQSRGKVEISNVLQEAVANLFSNCVYDVIASSSAVAELQSIIDQSSSATAAGISEWGIVALAFIGLLALTLPIIIPLVVAGKVITHVFMALFGFLLIGGGTYFLIAYGNQPGDEMVAVPFSKGIARYGPECSAVALGALSTEFKSSAEAAQACLEEPTCQAFDWKGWDTTKPELVPITPPQTQFYSSVKERCTAVMNNLDTKPPLIVNRGWIQGRGTPTLDTVSGTDGAVYVNTATGEYYIFSNDTGWGVPRGKLFGGITESQRLFIGVGSPDPQTGGIGDVYLQIDDPTAIYVWIKAGTPSQSYWTKLEPPVNGPGLHTVLPPSPNMTGFRVSGKIWWYYPLGIGLIVMGIIVLAVYAINAFFAQKRASAEGSSTSKSTKKATTKT